MDNEKMIQMIIDKATSDIMDRVQSVVREEVSDLVETMAATAAEVFGSSQKGDEENLDEQEEPIGVEIHMHGVKLDESDRLRFSQMICEFIASLDHDDEKTGGEGGEDAEEDEEEDEEELGTCVETVVIKINKDGKATLERKVVEKGSAE